MQTQSQLSITLTGITPAQYDAINNIVNTTTGDTGTTKKTATRSRRAPETTVDEEEEETFATRAMKSADLEDEEDDEAEETETEVDDEDDESTLSFDEVRDVMNRYGEKKPQDMKTILAGFNVKSTKELKTHPKLWEPVYRKVTTKLKALKKSK